MPILLFEMQEDAGPGCCPLANAGTCSLFGQALSPDGGRCDMCIAAEDDAKVLVSVMLDATGTDTVLPHARYNRKSGLVEVAPYGEAFIHGGLLAEDLVEVSHIRRAIFLMKEQCWTAARVAAWMNRRRVAPRSARRWNSWMVKELWRRHSKDDYYCLTPSQAIADGMDGTRTETEA